MNLMLELFIKYFKTTIIRNFQQAITNSLQTDGKKKKTQQRNICQKMPNRNCKTEEYNKNKVA